MRALSAMQPAWSGRAGSGCLPKPTGISHGCHSRPYPSGPGCDVRPGPAVLRRLLARPAVADTLRQRTAPSRISFRPGRCPQLDRCGPPETDRWARAETFGRPSAPRRQQDGRTRGAQCRNTHHSPRHGLGAASGIPHDGRVTAAGVIGIHPSTFCGAAYLPSR